MIIYVRNARYTKNKGFQRGDEKKYQPFYIRHLILMHWQKIQKLPFLKLNKRVIIMPHIFFRKLEKRKSTQSLFTLSALTGLEGLEQSLATSIQSQTRSLSQLFTTPYPFGSFYSPFSPYSSYYSPWSYFGQSYSPWSSWYSPYSYGFSSWASPWSYPLYSGYSPWSSWSYPTSAWSYPWTNNWAYPTSPTYPGSSSAYPPGTLYGLVKRSNLKA